MNRPTDNERLFTDALADAGPADFRERLLGETLRLARRRRQFRRMRRGAIAAGIVVLLAICFGPRTRSHLTKTNATIESYRLVETQPLPANEIVVTTPFAGQIVASIPATSVITTAESGDGLRELSDDELLALAPAPAALVRLGPHSAELVLANQSKSDLQKN
jgi:hypothetical protein